MPKKGVLFDNNFTLTGWSDDDPEPAVARELDISAEEYQAACHPYDYDFEHGFQVGMSASRRMRNILTDLGRPDRFDDIGKLIEAELTQIRERTFLLPGAVELLTHLRAAGFILVLCSNDSPYGINVARRRDLLTHFDATVFSCWIHKRKPDPEIYAACFVSPPLVPAECVLVDDGGDQSLIGAKKFNPNLKTIRVEHPTLQLDPKRPDLQADRVVKNLDAASAAIESLLG